MHNALIRVAAIVIMFAFATSTAQASQVTYTYDELGRVQTVTYDTGEITVYAYDPAGNRTAHVVSGSAVSPDAGAGSKVVIVLPLAGFTVISIGG